MSKDRQKSPPGRISVRLLDDKGELAKAPGDAVKAEVDSRALTADETRALRDEGEALLEAFRRKCKTAQGDELDHHLRSAVVMCAARPLPGWLFALLLKRLGREATVDEARWHEVRRAHDEEGLTWDTRTVYDADGQVESTVDGAFDTASKVLAGTFAAGAPRTMRESYAKVERELRRKGGGRPRTHRPRPPREG